ncbi:hypothetical protein BSLG_001311 [Batrachochytrium salamandrivorans]|nr:hypothetical protein BSLG_001311 [Batrachochytrium salamandrivorans]
MDARRKDFDSIFLGGTNGPQSVGRFKLSDVGLGWKSQTTGEIKTVPAADIRKLHWLRVARDYQLRVTRQDGSITMFDGFPKETYEYLASVAAQCYNTTLETIETSLKGHNWGEPDFQSGLLSFSVGKKTAFEIPLAQVSNTAVGGKNEVSIEFHPPVPSSSAEGSEHSRVKSKVDSLVEIRFFVPGNVTAAQVELDQNGRRMYKDKREEFQGLSADNGIAHEEGEISQQVLYDADGEVLTAAALFCDTVKQKADMDAVQSESIVIFSELLCITPRSRFVVEMHEAFFRLRGKSHDYKILYTAIKRFFLLPKPDDLHYMFIVKLDPPLRQGQTRYPYLVFQFGREEEIEIDLSIDEATISKKYGGALKKSYDGPVYEVVSEIFKGLSGVKVVTPSAQYQSANGQNGLRCSQKANEAILYPLDKSFLSIPKPPIFFSFSEIVAVTFSRVSAGSSTSTKTFEIKFSLNSGIEYSFSSISREEYGPLEEFCQTKRLPIRNELAEEAVTYHESDDDGEKGGKGQRRASSHMAADFGDQDDSESEDEDFVGASESDVGEEFSEDYQSSSDGEDGGNEQGYPLLS